MTDISGLLESAKLGDRRSLSMLISAISESGDSPSINSATSWILGVTGPPGSGKSTLVNHFLFSIFDENNYDNERLIYYNKSNFLNQFKDNIFPNIIYFKGSEFINTKIQKNLTFYLIF